MPRLLLLLLLCSVAPCGAQTRSAGLLDAAARITHGKQATVGFAALLPGAAETIASGDDDRYPMMSVFKLHVAVAALSKMEREKASLDEELIFPAEVLRPNTYSPLRDARADSSSLRITPRELLRYAISLSDNNACDLLIDLAGGTYAVDSCIRRAGIRDFAVTQTEHTMHLELRNCYANRTSPSAAVRLLKTIRDGRIISGEYLDALLRAMLATETGADKLRAGIPAEVPLGHKTGSSDRTPEGAKIGDNDARFIHQPDGRCCYLAVFIRDSREDDATNARMIARIAEAVYAEALHTESEQPPYGHSYPQTRKTQRP